VESGFLLDVVVGESASVFELLSSEDKSLLVRRNTFLILNLSLYIFNGIGRFYIKSDSLAC
jgi:hypothetical protein